MHGFGLDEKKKIYTIINNKTMGKMNKKKKINEEYKKKQIK